EQLLDSIKHDTVRILSHVQVRREDPAEEEARLRRQAEELAQRMQFKHEAAPGVEHDAEEPQGEPAAADTAGPITWPGPKGGQHHPCPCGSGKKYKQCHGSIV